MVERGYAEVGRRLEVVGDFEAVRSYSVSCLTDLTHPNGFVLTQPIQGTL